MRKVQTFLTTLGVVIGIGAVVAMLSLSAGYQSSLSSNFNSGLGLNILTVTPGGGRFFFRSGGGGSLPSSTSSITMNVTDASVFDTYANVANATAIMQQSIYYTMSDYNYTFNIIGVNFTAIQTIYPSFTTSLGILPTDPTNYTIILGADVANETALNLTQSIPFWYQSNVTGTPTWYQDTNSSVGGVLNSLGTSAFGMGLSDRGIYMSIQLMENLYGFQTASAIFVMLSSTDQSVITAVTDQIDSYYSNSVTVMSPDSMISTIESTLSTTTDFLF